MTSTARSILFLDIDGVLNGHDYDAVAKSCTIRPSCVASLNRVLEVTGCSIVVSSSWRYMILGGAVTLSGFEYLLRTHGVRCADRLVGHTAEDVPTGYKIDGNPVFDLQERGRQVKAWLAEHPEVVRYAVVDDMELGFGGMPFIQTDGTAGLTRSDADKLVGLLGIVRESTGLS